MRHAMLKIEWNKLMKPLETRPRTANGKFNHHDSNAVVGKTGRMLFVLLCLLLFSGVGANASDVVFIGEEDWAINGSTIGLTSAEVDNETDGGESGTLELIVWATTYPYEGGSIYGYALGTYVLGQL